MAISTSETTRLHSFKKVSLGTRMDELWAFLEHDRQLVRNEAVKIVLGLTGDPNNFELFKGSDFRPVKALKQRINDETVSNFLN